VQLQLQRTHRGDRGSAIALAGLEHGDDPLTTALPASAHTRERSPAMTAPDGPASPPFDARAARHLRKVPSSGPAIHMIAAAGRDSGMPATTLPYAP
jgi:hypothetical protein